MRVLAEDLPLPCVPVSGRALGTHAHSCCSTAVGTERPCRHLGYVRTIEPIAAAPCDCPTPASDELVKAASRGTTASPSGTVLTSSHAAGGIDEALGFGRSAGAESPRSAAVYRSTILPVCTKAGTPPTTRAASAGAAASLGRASRFEAVTGFLSAIRGESPALTLRALMEPREPPVIGSRGLRVPTAREVALIFRPACCGAESIWSLSSRRDGTTPVFLPLVVVVRKAGRAGRARGPFENRPPLIAPSKRQQDKRDTRETWRDVNGTNLPTARELSAGWRPIVGGPSGAMGLVGRRRRSALSILGCAALSQGFQIFVAEIPNGSEPRLHRPA